MHANRWTENKATKVSLDILNTADPRYTTPISSTALQRSYISDKAKLNCKSTKCCRATHSTTLKALRIRVILRMRRTLTTLKSLASCLTVVDESTSSTEHLCTHQSVIQNTQTQQDTITSWLVSSLQLDISTYESSRKVEALRKNKHQSLSKLF
jgi:hypothetical protein